MNRHFKPAEPEAACHAGVVVICRLTLITLRMRLTTAAFNWSRRLETLWQWRWRSRPATQALWWGLLQRYQVIQPSCFMLMSVSVINFSVAKIANYCIDHKGVVWSEDNVRKRLAKKKCFETLMAGRQRWRCWNVGWQWVPKEWYSNWKCRSTNSC